MTRDSMAMSKCSVNFAISYCRFKYGKNLLRFYASDITLKGENVTTVNKKAVTMFLPSEEVGLIIGM
jgi:hypothetical protein